MLAFLWIFPLARHCINCSAITKCWQFFFCNFVCFSGRHWSPSILPQHWYHQPLNANQQNWIYCKRKISKYFWVWRCTLVSGIVCSEQFYIETKEIKSIIFEIENLMEFHTESLCIYWLSITIDGNAESKFRFIFHLDSNGDWPSKCISDTSNVRLRANS